MKIELGIAIYTKEELKWLSAGLYNLLDSSKHHINPTLYLSHITQPFLDECIKVCEKYNINFEPRGDDTLIKYYDELKHRAFDIQKNECAVVIQPDVLFTKKNSFDEILDEASQYFDKKYQINVSTDYESDTLPLAIQIYTKKMWQEIGCGDINYYPAPGSEYDEYRRCCIAWEVDFLNDNKTYNKYLDGIHDPPFNHRIRSKDLIHVHKFRGNTKKDYPTDSQLFRKAKDYGIFVEETCLRFYDIHFLEYHNKKWGGHLGQEKFLFPFNDKNKSIKIDWENSLDPYPETDYVSLRGLVV